MRERTVERGDLAALECSNAGLLADSRVLLAALALCLVLLEPEQRLRLGRVMLLYLVYAIALRRRVTAGHLDHWCSLGPWIDLACYSVLIAWSGSLGSRFLMFLLYPIAVVSFSNGLRRGMQMAFVCVFMLMGMDALQAGSLSHAEHLSAKPLLLLLALAMMIARWAHAEVALRQRLAFSNDLNRYFSPNSTLEQGVGSLARILRLHQKADACLLIMGEPGSASWCLYRADSDDAKPAKAEPVDEKIARPLLDVPAGQAAFYCRSRLPWRRPVFWGYDLARLKSCPADPAVLSAVANLLETRSFISLPVRSRNQALGRCYLTSSKTSYARHDVRFLSQLIGQAGVMIENMQLLERLSLEVVREERRKISRDLHDGTIQPYIGLKLGLEVLRLRVPARGAIAREIDELIHMASDGISQLQRYVGDLKIIAPGKSCAYLLAAVRLQAEKFSRYYGIESEVAAERDIAVEGPLHEEIMQIVREGLSNIRRHTSATRAVIGLRADQGRLVLEFTNNARTAAHFCPRSIQERAKELGGRVSVRHHGDEHTVVVVELPY